LKKSPSLTLNVLSFSSHKAKTSLEAALRLVSKFYMKNPPEADFKTMSKTGPKNRFEGRFFILSPGQKYTEA
jgi:hypothetical protein